MRRVAWSMGVVALGVALCAPGCGGEGDDQDGGVTVPDATLPMNEPCSTPGALETVACGACGTVERFCSASSRWEYGVCGAEIGPCIPGSTRGGACGACGTRRELCTTACTWEGTSECTGEGACVAGELSFTREGCDRGQREMLCNETCELEPVGECTFEACPTPGALETVACGMCGTRDRFCSAAGEWEYGVCEGQGGCMPGTSEEMACGACGTQATRCNDRCEWVPTGACGGEGECVPGTRTTRSEGCSSGETRPYECSASCEYREAGSCGGGVPDGGVPDGGVPDGGVPGMGCPDGICGAGLVCSTGTGVAVCRTPCTDSSMCGLNHCFTTDAVCSDACTLFTDAGCPAGSKCDFMGYADELGLTSIRVCSGVGSGTTGAFCTLNSQCARGYTCLTDTTGTAGSCSRVCDGTHPCPSPQTCNAGGGSGLPFPSLGDIGYCE